MKIRLTKEMVINALEKYYKEQLDFEGKASITPKKELSGYGSMESYRCVLDMKITGKITFMGVETSAENQISQEELKNALSYCLGKEGYTFMSLETKSGLSEKSSDYYRDEATTYTPYFNGIDVVLKEKTKSIGGIKK